MTPATDPLLAVLRAHDSRIRSVRYRSNRTVLLSVSRDGRTLNSHVCFRNAPPEILGAVARFVTARRSSAAAARALDRLRTWEGTHRGLESARRQQPRRARPATDGPDTLPLRRLFRTLNRERFDDRLPEIPLRLSRRMTRSLGTIRYEPESGSVLEIAISADLLLPVNRESLEDTLLHEMAHAEAWLEHRHQGHGRPWRRVAERVGCAPRATCRVPIARSRSRRG